MVLVSVFTVIGLVAHVACAFEVGFIGFGSRDSSRLENLLCEDIGRNWRQRGNTALEVIPAVKKKKAVSTWILSNSHQRLNLLPVTLHVALLQIDIPIGDLAGVAGVRMGGRVGTRGADGLHARHVACGLTHRCVLEVLNSSTMLIKARVLRVVKQVEWNRVGLRRRSRQEELPDVLFPTSRQISRPNLLTEKEEK